MSTDIYTSKKKPYNLLRKWLFWQEINCARNLSPSGRRVASRLLFHLNATSGACFPQEQTLADSMGISERQVQRAIRELVKEKWLIVKHRYNQSNEYSFNWSRKASDPTTLSPSPDVSDPTTLSPPPDNLVSPQETNQVQTDTKNVGLTWEDNKGNEQGTLTRVDEEDSLGDEEVASEDFMDKSQNPRKDNPQILHP